MNRRSLLKGLLALPFLPAVVKLLPQPVRERLGLEEAMFDAAALAAREHGRPDMLFVNRESFERLSHELEHGHREYDRNLCPTCLEYKVTDLKRRLVAKYRPAAMAEWTFDAVDRGGFDAWKIG